MERKCVVCHDREFAVRCIQCHKPVCSECAFTTEHGSFCSRNCAASYRDYMKSRPQAGRGRSPVAKLLLVAIVLAALAAGAIYVVKPGLLPFLNGGDAQQTPQPAEPAP